MSDNIQGQRHDRTALILYGSETGNSEDVAEELGRVTERLHFKTRVSEMNLVEINELFKYTIVIFAISTTGQGEFPKNARKFWKSLLRKRLPPGCLSHVAFTTFGLGDSSYPRFNWSARKLHKRLEQLGAQEVYPRGEADEQDDGGIDGAFLSWSLDLRKHLLSSYPLPDDVFPLPADAILPFKYHLVLADPDEHAITPSSSHPKLDNSIAPLTEEESRLLTQLKGAGPVDAAPVDTTLPPSDRLEIPNGACVNVLENKRVTPDSHWQDVRKLTFVTSARDCGRSRRSDSSVDLYHEKRSCGRDCGERCGNGEECKEVCGDMCRGKCRGPCQETYHPGDTVTIYPKNFPADIDALISHMNWSNIADQEVIFKGTMPDFFSPNNTLWKVPNLFPFQSAASTYTIRKLLTHHLDIMAIPKRSFFKLISNLTDDETHKARLLEFSDPAFSDDYFDYATRPRRSILEVLQEFPSVRIPWQDVTHIFPKIRGRQFSIASGGDLKANAQEGLVQFELLIAIVKYKTVLRKVRQGVCSRYIAALQPGTILNVAFESNQKFDVLARKRPELPIIMIAPGTGVAPCRALIWEREQTCVKPLDEPSLHRNSFDEDGEKGIIKKRENNKTRPEGPEQNHIVGETVLFFGNRNRTADYFYHDEWKNLKLQVFTAFSRDQREKIYIQDIIRREGALIRSLIAKEAIIYVCGSSGSMPKAVKEALLVTLEERFPKREDAVAYLEKLERDGHYIQETW